ncbi:noggin-2-like [Tachyglossus aculeatus]|uniref:noggin-2-like n=1 Tax=Tachyglossus aculeatus TaxID=9261 RepID=UPI0018F5714E|nr:noggin-2-like [Tachyglossus aculeatus]
MALAGALLLCSYMALAPAGSGQPFLRLRPSPSDSLPVKDIIEHPDPDYDPKEQDLDERALRQRLGSHLDPGFMSVAAPPPGGAGGGGGGGGGRDGDGGGGGELRRLDLGEGPAGARVKLGRKARRRLAQWLWAYTSCPVVYTWKDLGLRFWPRYLREGSCPPERSCSLPQGMFCRPARSVPKTLLRWHCQGWARHKYCTWIPVQYPVISECKCSC